MSLGSIRVFMIYGPLIEAANLPDRTQLHYYRTTMRECNNVIGEWMEKANNHRLRAENEGGA